MSALRSLEALARKLRLAAIGAALVSAISSVSQASITNAVAYGYSPAIYCYPMFDDATDVLRLGMNQFAAGDLGGTIFTDSVADPTLTLLHVINNSTGTGWSSYHVDIFMPNIFSISGAIVNSPGGWASLVIGPAPVAGGYQGQVEYTGGPVIQPGGTLNFQFDITFADGLAYSFTEHAVPGLVPEPSTVALAMMGLAACGLRRSRRLV